jgi:predicted nucleotidyltransferase component of viral defense system
LIPRASITTWRKTAPWADDAQIEQDLVLSRALVELFNNRAVAENLVFRGGTALHKLFFDPPGRYSEDIDLVQRNALPIGSVVDEIRAVLDPWLGKPKWKAGQGRFTLTYRFETTFTPVEQRRVKIEINTREHFAVHGFTSRRFAVLNPWFTGETHVSTYVLSELLGTKLRALYQRKKGRDLFDLSLALTHAEFDASLLVEAFNQYMIFGGTPVTRAQFEANMAAKIGDQPFIEDVPPLLRTGLSYDVAEAWLSVHAAIITHLSGEAWKGDGDAR